MRARAKQRYLRRERDELKASEVGETKREWVRYGCGFPMMVIMRVSVGRVKRDEKGLPKSERKKLDGED